MLYETLKKEVKYIEGKSKYSLKYYLLENDTNNMYGIKVSLYKVEGLSIRFITDEVIRELTNNLKDANKIILNLANSKKTPTEFLDICE